MVQLNVAFDNTVVLTRFFQLPTLAMLGNHVAIDYVFFSILGKVLRSWLTADECHVIIIAEKSNECH